MPRSVIRSSAGLRDEILNRNQSTIGRGLFQIKRGGAFLHRLESWELRSLPQILGLGLFCFSLNLPTDLLGDRFAVATQFFEVNFRFVE